MKEVCEILNVTKTRTTPFHSQSDGLIERFNCTLLQMLSTAVIDHEEDWDLQLPLQMLAYRTSVQETTKATPFSLMFGREIHLPIDVMFDTPCEQSSCPSQHASNLRTRLDDAYSRVQEQMKLAQRQQKTLYDHKNKGAPFNVGDRVWLHIATVPRGASRKFHRPWQGPYKAVKVLSDVVYRIQKEDSPRKRCVVHFDRLKPYVSKAHARIEPEGTPLLPLSSSSNQQPNVRIEPEESQERSDAESQPQLRRSARTRKPPEFYGNPVKY